MFPVRAGENGGDEHLLLVVAGPEQADPDAAPSQPPQPRPSVEPRTGAGIGGTGGLAYTGANLTWLAIGGLLALGLGAGLVPRRGRFPAA